MEKSSETILVKTRKGSTYVQWTVGLIANSLLFSYGLQSGWMSPMAKVLQSPSSPMGAPLSDLTLGWVASIMPITALVFVPVFTFLADKYGRRTSILVMTVPQAVCWLLKLFGTNTTCLVLARVCSGVTAGGCFTIVPMYNKEISQESLRGLMGSMFVLACNMGLVVMYAIGAYLDYYTVLYIVTGLPILTFLLMLKCPESPDYLVKMEKFDEAVQTTAFLRGLDEDDKSLRNEIDKLRKHNEYYKTLPALSTTVILKDRAWRKAFVIAIIMISIQALSGNFALVSYGASILVASGADMDAELMTITFPAVMMLSSIASMCFVDRVGRKVLLIMAYVVSALSLGCLALMMQLPPGTAPGWMFLSAILLSMVAFAAGVMPVPYIIMMEIFNMQIRATLMGLVLAQSWSLSFIQLAAFAPMTAAMGMHANFYFFAAVHLVGIAAVLALLPETRGKSIEEIENEFRNK